MPIRIYALAKEFNLDSKELVDVCKKAGIHGKGSALASLDDDEVTKLRAHMAGPSTKKEAKPAPVVDNSPVRATKLTDHSTVKHITRPKRKSRLTAETPPLAAAELETSDAEPTEEAPTDVEPVQASADDVVTDETTPSEAEAMESETPDVDENAPLRRGDYLSPGRRGGIKVITKAGDGKAADAPRPKKPRAPVINVKLGKMPQAKPAPKAAKPNEPKAQKPVIRLPKDAIAPDTKAPLKQQLADVEAKQNRKTSREQQGEAPAADAKPGSKRRRGGKAEKTEATGDRMAGMANTRVNRQSSRRQRSGPRFGDDRHYRGRRRKRSGKNTAAPRKDNVSLALPCTVRSFSEASGAGQARVLGALMKMGVEGLNINAGIPDELVEELVLELGVEVDIRQHESLEDEMLTAVENIVDDEDDLEIRPPIITFLGHVDHGKTSLLDRIIGLDVVSGEAGGITQHIRAYKIEDSQGRDISFVDTPGHEAFTEMRARGANVTDIAVLVVAADDGIMPQTAEAISHAKAAEVPIVVALNKIDLPGVDINRVMTQMTEYELTPSEWGGDVEVVQTSAITGEGVDDLLETIQGIAELHELTANPTRQAYGVCLEAEQEGSRGVVSKMIIENGTLEVGDIVVCGESHGRVKAMHDTLRTKKKIKSAGPSSAVNITGFDTPPAAGDKFYVVDDIVKAREIAAKREQLSREKDLSGVVNAIDYENFMLMLEEGRLGKPDEVVTLNLIVRADVRGSIEAIQKELGKLDHPEVKVKVLLAGVGGVTYGDVTLADASKAVIVAFNVIPNEAARQLADERSIEIRRYEVIYKITDDIRAMLEGRLKPEERVVDLGRALVKQVFPISRVGSVAGCYVAQGTIERGCRIRVYRDGRSIGDYPLDSLRREKDDIKSVPRGMECGIKLSGFNDIKQDDVLEAYKIEEVARKL